MARDRREVSMKSKKRVGAFHSKKHSIAVVRLLLVVLVVVE